MPGRFAPLRYMALPDGPSKCTGRPNLGSPRLQVNQEFGLARLLVDQEFGLPGLLVNQTRWFTCGFLAEILPRHPKVSQNAPSRPQKSLKFHQKGSKITQILQELAVRKIQQLSHSPGQLKRKKSQNQACPLSFPNAKNIGVRRCHGSFLNK